MEVSIDGPAGRIEGAALRLYEPEVQRLSFDYFNAGDGQLTPPLAGSFVDGVGTFCGDDTLRGKPIVVRFVISKLPEATTASSRRSRPTRARPGEVNSIPTASRSP